MAISPDLLYIASMLDDADENVGVNLLAQLVNRADELGELPALLQESSDPVVRRRAHQLQSALAMRKRRDSFYARINSDAPDALRALEELHLLWFDRDNALELHSATADFCEEFRNAGCGDLESIEFFMRRKNILPAAESTIQPENFCIGTVLDRRTGATSLLLALAVFLAGKPELKLVRVLDEFAVYDGRGQLLLGSGSWRLCRAPEAQSMEFWSLRMILKYLAGMLLSCAVNSDSYRYVMSIAQALNGDKSEHVFDGFPYPFQSGKDDEEQL